MKEFSQEEWKDFQERVKRASLGERTTGVNFFTVNFKVWTHSDSSVSLQKEPSENFIRRVPIEHNYDDVKGIWWKWEKEEDFRKLKRQLFVSNNEWIIFCYKMYYLRPFTDREWEIFDYLMHTSRGGFSLGMKASFLSVSSFRSPTKDHFVPIIKLLKDQEKIEKNVHKEKDHVRIVIGLLLTISLLIILIFRLYFFLIS